MEAVDAHDRSALGRRVVEDRSVKVQNNAAMQRPRPVAAVAPRLAPVEPWQEPVAATARASTDGVTAKQRWVAPLSMPQPFVVVVRLIA